MFIDTLQKGILKSNPQNI